MLLCQTKLQTIDVKNLFLRFFLNFGHVFLRFKRFFNFPNVCKIQRGKEINKKHFQNSSSEIQWVHK